jgi:hypothetical protein
MTINSRLIAINTDAMNFELFIVIVLIVVAIFAMLAAIDWRKRQRVNAAWSEGRRPERTDMNHRTQWVKYICESSDPNVKRLPGPV